MPEMQFCYCCRVHHPREQMTLFPTRYGQRWRCLRSIAAASSAQSLRDSFGKEQTRINREAAARLQALEQPRSSAGLASPPAR